MGQMRFTRFALSFAWQDRHNWARLIARVFNGGLRLSVSARGKDGELNFHGDTEKKIRRAYKALCKMTKSLSSSDVLLVVTEPVWAHFVLERLLPTYQRTATSESTIACDLNAVGKHARAALLNMLTARETSLSRPASGWTKERAQPMPDVAPPTDYGLLSPQMSANLLLLVHQARPVSRALVDAQTGAIIVEFADHPSWLLAVLPDGTVTETVPVLDLCGGFLGTAPNGTAWNQVFARSDKRVQEWVQTRVRFQTDGSDADQYEACF
jgi:hypothetical protein